MNYSVYAGGIHALNATLDIDLTKKERFSVELFAKTYGLLGKLAPWFGTFETHGWFNKGKARPELHQSSTTWKDELEVKKYQYNKDGSFKEYSIKDDSNNGSPREVDSKLTDQTTDILSATLEMMAHVASGQECEGTSEIFDGKRRYRLIFDHKKQLTLEKSRYNIYEGAAVKCTVKVEPIAGRWHKKPRGWFAIQEQGKKKGSMPTIWLASVNEGEPAIPVKVRAKTQYGTFFLHLIGYEGQGMQLALDD
ncbi:MAG: DUF3108 domain-containing protein [Alphaproteobacteria bacterium]|nr:DUF3108 domain-containing protein [Alphaproteobacteria bacterium]